ncbi:hypothetical protein PVAND_013318 [Polypedilum vanderplanki]|uniref:Uncharacterized protein n=1 Tax=Polypedilum vanderplanki TaxID=319348 RepID=A0A9J6CPZ8_POLVA|nr:hypothetical protein PVAND_013318 [Polypedilum vanderplanki]
MSNEESLVKKFASESSLHAVQFVFNDKHRLASRLFWIFSLTISLMTFGYYVRNGYRKWLVEPDVSTTMKRILVREIPFPAITICSPLFAKSEFANRNDFMKLMQTFDFAFQDCYLPIDKRDHMTVSLEACNHMGSSYYIKTIPRINFDNVEILGESYKTVDEAMTQSVKVGKYENCSNNFNRVLTYRGFCYSFNMQGTNIKKLYASYKIFFSVYKRLKIRKSFDNDNKNFKKFFIDEDEKVQWTIDKGYLPEHEDNSAPMVAKKDNFITTSSQLNLNDSVNLCLEHQGSYSYYFHLANEILTPMHEDHKISIGLSRYLKLSAKWYKTSDDLRIIDPTIRGCYFGDERKLKYFKTYTKALCEYECMIEKVFKKCSCVSFLMPRNETMKVCRHHDEIDCYGAILHNWLAYNENDTHVDELCGCLKNCNDIVYSMKILGFGLMRIRCASMRIHTKLMRIRCASDFVWRFFCIAYMLKSLAIIVFETLARAVEPTSQPAS